MAVNTDLIQVTAGATGAAGVAGPQINTLSIELEWSASGISPFLTLVDTYIVEKGGIWEPSANHIFTLDSTFFRFTLTNFLKTASNTKKFSPSIYRKQVTRTPVLDPNTASRDFIPEIWDFTTGASHSIEVRVINAGSGAVQRIDQLRDRFTRSSINEIVLTLNIFGEDDF